MCESGGRGAERPIGRTEGFEVSRVRTWGKTQCQWEEERKSSGEWVNDGELKSYSYSHGCSSWVYRDFT